MNVLAVGKRLLSGVVVFLVLMGLMVAVALAATAPPLNLPAYSVNATYGNYLGEFGWPAAFRIRFSGIGTGYSVSDSVDYLGWCLEDNHLDNSSTITLYSSYDPNLPDTLAKYTDSSTPAVVNGQANVGDPIPWDKLNYLLNHKPSGGTDVTNRADTQAAIKILIYGATTNPVTSTAALAAATDALNNGAGFVPGPGQVMAVILYVDGIDSLEGHVPPGHYQEAIIELPLNYDFGDLPSTYPTLLANDGARHLVGPDLYLGQCVDAESDGQPNATATGDDNAVGTLSYGTCASPGDDEDGVVPTPNIKWQTGSGGGSVNVTVAGGQGCLSGWIDWGNDNSLTDSGDNILNNILLPVGTSTLTFTVPVNPNNGTFYARFRLYPVDPGTVCTTARTPTGAASGGEVEDYQWRFGPNAVSLSTLQASSRSVIPFAPLALVAIGGFGAAAWWTRRRRS